MTDECIQIMGGMGFMKVRDGSLPLGAGWAGRRRQAHVTQRHVIYLPC